MYLRYRLLLMMLVALTQGLSFGQLALAQVVAPWSNETPPEGWADTQHDAFDDPYHPLKNPSVDPGAATAGSAESPAVSQFRADWNWGERYFSQEFPVVLTISNNCETQQLSRIFVNGPPYLEFEREEVMVQRKSSKNIRGKVKLPGPPKPPPPQPGGVPSPGFGWVDPPNLGPQPLGTPPPIFHQPNWVPIDGEVVVWHPWAPDGPDGECLPERTRYTIGGHMHWRPPGDSDEDVDKGPFTLARSDPCEVWWNSYEEPAQREGDCTRAMQLLAERFLLKVVPDYWRNAPEEWGWLVRFGGVDDKSVDQLLQMKARASAIIGR
ncbi:hypothetical protein [Congregibacter litoralis]|uniref:Uncharacterized protein n=1 Tax=Congregibacter litoralis KT71 TaxID=314285 RepID=A4ABP5_9GAMM|nr:hypothetical protein [Congregibacter litoralis]EAQ96558.2 hypothetical protein KT71_06022 [Congregibacter litoralis KT71]